LQLAKYFELNFHLPGNGKSYFLKCIYNIKVGQTFTLAASLEIGDSPVFARYNSISNRLL